MRDIIFKINEIFISLLAFQYNERQELEYNKIDLTAINSEILRQTEFGCNLPPLNVVILEPSGSLNDDNEILRAMEIYRRDFSLEENDFLDICADEAIFRRLIKCRNKSENIRPILVSFGHSGGLPCSEEWENSKDSIEWASEERKTKKLRFDRVQLASETKIRKYEFVRLGFGGLLKNEKELRFINVFELKSTVSHFPDRIVSASLSRMIGSINRTWTLFFFFSYTREGHYPAFDEALETHGVAYIKQNITGNSCNQENLELQIKATQEERNRIDTLLNEFLGTYSYQHKDRNTNNRIEPLWKLVHDLLEAFEMDNSINHDLFKKNSPPQLNQEGLIKINQAYMDGLKRIKEIFRQEVIKTEAINTKGKRSVKGNLKRVSIELDNQNESQPKRQRIRIITTEEEKQILSCLLQKETIPTETEINEVLSKLSQEWNIQRVKRYWNNNIRHKKKSK
ncbi:hypothetical protein GLOIN_2v1469926 [Rhizophagus irregularis DAOM 181602=DAOM 197198]|nr:hypothetical protein GLOIN_2v1469926 [Rhizophagus irregularis DAOM 181602=DAOM 197198]